MPTQIVCPSPNVWDLDEKSLYWALVVRGTKRKINLESDVNSRLKTNKQTNKAMSAIQNNPKSKWLVF